LSDRPNSADQVLAGSVEFSDDSTIAIGPLPNDGQPAEYTFPARRVRSLRLSILNTSAATENVGLAEFAVWEVSSSEIVSTPAASGTSRPQPVTPPVAETGTASARGSTPGGGRPGTVTSAGGRNIAAEATVSVSSERAPVQTGRKAVDLIVSGYPSAPESEWVTAGETSGAWIELRWDTPRLLSRARLHDRVNLDDCIESGALTFSDGSGVLVRKLANDGSGVDVTFTPRTVRWMRFTVTSTSATTVNAGLAEVAVFEDR
jgi:hypothetical protein